MIISKNMIVAHRQGGLSIPVSRPETDISTTNMTFVTKSGLSVPLVADPANPLGKLLKLTKTQIQSVTGSTEFALVNTDTEAVLWSGTLKIEGF